MDLASTDTRNEQRVRVVVCSGYALAGARVAGPPTLIVAAQGRSA